MYVLGSLHTEKTITGATRRDSAPVCIGEKEMRVMVRSEYKAWVVMEERAE